MSVQDVDTSEKSLKKKKSVFFVVPVPFSSESQHNGLPQRRLEHYVG